MIYRIHHDERYLMHVIPPVESMRKLGEEHGTFAFNAEPKVYANVWRPLQLEFCACEGKKTNAMPDVSENFGRLFLSQKAFEALSSLIEPYGEFLPVTFKGDEGFLFNPLHTAEQHNAIDTTLKTYDQYGNLENFGFLEDRLRNTNIFKTGLDTWKGIFCTDALKHAYEKAELKGIAFSPDAASPIGEPYGPSH